MDGTNITLQQIYDEALGAGFTVLLDERNDRLVFEVGSNGFDAIFQFMEPYKIRTRFGPIYPVTFAIFDKIPIKVKEV